MNEIKGYKIIKEITLKQVIEEKGILSICQLKDQISFDIQRIYFIQNVPEGFTRGRHGHKKLEQIFVCISGQFTLEVFDGKATETIDLNNNSNAIYVPAKCWRELKNFTVDGICLVLASTLFDYDDYINNLEDFKEWKNSQ